MAEFYYYPIVDNSQIGLRSPKKKRKISFQIGIFFVPLQHLMKRNNRIKYLIYTYLTGMAVFMLFRIASILVYCFSAEAWPSFGGHLLKALLIGLRFDTVVSCYLLAIPLLLMVIAHFSNIKSGPLYRILNTSVSIAYMACFFACAVDIPFFSHFFTRLNAMALVEVESFDIIISMILGEPRYLAALLAYAAAMVGYGFAQHAIYAHTLQHIQRHRASREPLPRAVRILMWTMGIAILFIGMRGGLGKRPIRVSSANYCSHPFLNQLGLNPVFTFLKSTSNLNKSNDAPFDLIDPASAQRIYDLEHNTPIDSTLAASAIQLPEGTNVVLVIMESMTAEKLGQLTPSLNSISAQSLWFTQAYSAGIHTYNGVYSTLYSTPSIPGRHTMYHTFIPRMSGLPWVLHDKGYRNAFFMPHDEHFDNMEPFLYGNGFDSVVGQHSYDPNKVVGTWGVPDHVLFDYALDHCNRMAPKGPFFTTIITCSDHTPYILPTNIQFQPKSTEIAQQMVEYADWSIGRFIALASQQPWFDNTLFVFTADHGVLWGESKYEIALSYHHVPMIFYCPKHIQPQKCHRLALQIDLGPTLLGMIPHPQPNETFGLDLLRQQRQTAYFCSDDKVCALDSSHLYIYHMNDNYGTLYHYTCGDLTDYAHDDPDRASRMKEYSLGLIQQAYLIQK